jgi:uncharacterized membrane protein YeaQ/YmgE (transglycosylase-associated protein family)
MFYNYTPERSSRSVALEPILRGRTMNMSSESLLVILFVGVVAGWLAGQIIRGTGFGIIGDLIVGILGAFIGSWLLPQLGLHLGTGVVSAIVNATIGAMLLLLIVRLVRGGGGWGSRWGGGWGSRWGGRWGSRW